MTTTTTCRRRQRRLRLPPGLTATVRFRFGALGPESWTMRLNDMSGSGLSFHLDRDLPGLEIGDSLKGMVLSLGDNEIRGDLLVMHLTPGPEAGAVCGGLFFPADDQGIVIIQELLRRAERTT